MCIPSKTIQQVLLLFQLIILMDNTAGEGAEDWKKWTKEELEKQMSPSRWNPKKSAEEVIQEYINDGLAETKNSIETVPHELNIQYGTKESEKLDLYGTDLPEDSPIFVFIHGGYWQEGSKEISGGFAKLNHGNKFKTVALGYTLAPQATVHEMEKEIVGAIDFLMKKFQKSKFIIVGHSAGAQLASHLLYRNNLTLSREQLDRIAGLVLVSGVFDLRPLVNTYVNQPLRMSFADAESSSSLLTANLNPNITPDKLKIMVIVGSLDSPEFNRQSLAYYEKLKKTFPNTKYWKSEGDDHFEIVQNMAKGTTPCANQVQEFLKSCVNKGSTGGGSIGSSTSTTVLVSLVSVFLFIASF